mgnify:FL=1
MKKTVLVTGASGGIGSEICRIFAENGFDVIMQYRKNEKAAFALKEELEARFGAEVFPLCADLSKGGECEKLSKQALALRSKIDVLVNNAGVSIRNVFQLVEEADAKRLFAVNIESAMRLCQLILPQMIRRKSGKIVNVSSMWGVSGGSCEVHYSASKAAMIGFTKALSKEVGPSKINVNCVAPGFIETEMNACFDEETKREIALESSLQKNGTPRDVAELVFFLSSEKAAFITGQTIGIDGGR